MASRLNLGQSHYYREAKNYTESLPLGTTVILPSIYFGTHRLPTYHPDRPNRLVQAFRFAPCLRVNRPSVSDVAVA
jgi:hypothetical protein